MLGKITFDERVNVLERYCKGDISITFTNLKGSLSKIKILKGQVSRSGRIHALQRFPIFIHVRAIIHALQIHWLIIASDERATHKGYL